MTKRRVTTLLAVCTIATTTTVAANPTRSPAPPTPARAVAAERRVEPPPAAATTQPARTLERVPSIVEAALVVLGISIPRRLPTGAPACGNVATKAPRMQTPACDPHDVRR